MDADAPLLHQVPSAKLSHRHLGHARFWCAAVAAASRLDLATQFLPPMMASAAVLCWADVPALRQHPAGGHVLAHLPPAAAAARLAGNAAMTYGGLAPPPAAVVAGLALIGLGSPHSLGAAGPHRSEPNG